jgi:thiol-disulfide isomerase/thioredoxin
VTTGRRVALVVAILAVMQGGAVLLYRSVQDSRTRDQRRASFPTERLPGAEVAPSFVTHRLSGEGVNVPPPGASLRIVHFWATWCVPCREEIPSLLRASRELAGVSLVAVAVDDERADIEKFFEGSVPREIVIPADTAAHKLYGVSTLPDTYLVNRNGRLIERIHGARDWSSPAAREHILGLTATKGSPP